ncbi:MAG: DUF6364 family protein [Gammaproteobacteria bacterium]|nr:DUF6364 family protein [Gammaproteobacteria bacterium]MDE0193876.1 DUF6364 family protein [Gammaproteobacteria bacterium]
MQTKLTLRMDDRLIAGAKQHAARAGKSLSQVVAEYFLVCTSGSPGSVDETPRVSRLRGCLKDTGAAEADYLKHLEDKHS